MVTLGRDYNPFANIDLHIPQVYREQVTRFTSTQSSESQSEEEVTPFVRYVDLWCFAAAVGAETQVFVSEFDRHRFIAGSVLQGDLVRIEFLQWMAIAHTSDPYIVQDPRRMIDIADSYAAGGLPMVLEWLEDGTQTSLTSLTKKVIDFLNSL